MCKRNLEVICAVMENFVIGKLYECRFSDQIANISQSECWSPGTTVVVLRSCECLIRFKSALLAIHSPTRYAFVRSAWALNVHTGMTPENTPIAVRAPLRARLKHKCTFADFYHTCIKNKRSRVLLDTDNLPPPGNISVTKAAARTSKAVEGLTCFLFQAVV